MRSWKGEGITHPELIAVAVSLTERAGGYGVVYAGTSPTAVYRSEDGGNTWRELKELLKLPSGLNLGFARPALQKPCTLDYT